MLARFKRRLTANALAYRLGGRLRALQQLNCPIQRALSLPAIARLPSRKFPRVQSGGDGSLAHLGKETTKPMLCHSQSEPKIHAHVGIRVRRQTIS
jgi:hypothetical protein